MDSILLDAIEYNGGGINTLLNKGTIKSVQHGYTRIYRNSMSGNIPYEGEGRIDISPVDRNKSVLILERGDTLDNDSFTNIYIADDGRALIVNNDKKMFDYYLSWQVIEFY